MVIMWNNDNMTQTIFDNSLLEFDLTNSASSGSNLKNKDKIYASIKIDIIRCNLAPGMAISEAKLAAKYGCGKASVRYALARLCHENLVASQPRKCHVISPITIRGFIEITEMRLILEPAAAGMAAGKIDEPILRQLAADCSIPIENIDQVAVQGFLSTNSKFHRAIAHYSGNQRLAGQITNLLEDTERVRHIAMASGMSQAESIAEHSALVEALAEGRSEDAAHLTKLHLRRGCKLILACLLSRFQLMDFNLDSNISTNHPNKNKEYNDLKFADRLVGSKDIGDVLKLVNGLGGEVNDDSISEFLSSQSEGEQANRNQD